MHQSGAELQTIDLLDDKFPEALACVLEAVIPVGGTQ